MENLTQRVANSVTETTGMRGYQGESRFAAFLVNASITLVMVGWVLIWLGWIVHGVWKITLWIKTGTAPVLRLRELGVSIPNPWPLVQPVVDFVLDTGLGLLLFIAGTAAYVIFGGVLMFFVFLVIRSVEVTLRNTVGRVRRRRKKP